MKRGFVPLAGLVLLLAVARLSPETGAGLWLRLLAATALVLAPGALLALALRVGSVSATAAFSLLLVFGALVVVFALGTPLIVALLLLVAAAAALAARKLQGVTSEDGVAVGPAAGLGLLLGVAVWQVCGPIGGDGFFHLGRVRKLAELDELSLHAVGEFADGGLHPGYAFPLWHGFLALVAEVAAVDPEAVVRYLPALLVPLAVALAYEAGWQVFRARGPAAAAAVGQVALIALSPGHGGAYATLTNPGTATRQLLVPAAIALFFAYLHERAWPTLAALGATALAIALVHPTYAIFLAVPLAAFVVVRLVVARADLVAGAVAMGAFLLPVALAFLWLLPIVRETASHDPGRAEVERALVQYRTQLVVDGHDSYRLAARTFGRSGTVAVAALVLLPLAVFAARRRWAAFALGGFLALFALMLVPELFTRVSDLVSLSQSRRAAGFVPFAVAFAGGLAVLVRHLRLAALPVALAAGTAAQLAWPGAFGKGLAGAPPGALTWIAAAGAVVALGVALVIQISRDDGAGGTVALAAALFVLPVAVHAVRTWDPREREGARGLTPGLVEALRERVPERDVVFADLETSYRIAAFAPVYVAAAPPAHVADTRDNRPYARREDVIGWLETGRVPRAYGAEWLVVDRENPPEHAPNLDAAYEDERYELYRLPRR